MAHPVRNTSETSPLRKRPRFGLRPKRNSGRRNNMPPYSTPVQPAVLGPPITPAFPLFNNEARTVGDISIPFQWNPNQTGFSSVTKIFTATFATAPTTATINILCSDTNNFSSASAVAGSITISGGTVKSGVYNDTGASKWYAAQLTAQTGGGNVTVTVSA